MYFKEPTRVSSTHQNHQNIKITMIWLYFRCLGCQCRARCINGSIKSSVARAWNHFGMGEKYLNTFIKTVPIFIYSPILTDKDRPVWSSPFFRSFAGFGFLNGNMRGKRVTWMYPRTCWKNEVPDFSVQHCLWRHSLTDHMIMAMGSEIMHQTKQKPWNRKLPVAKGSEYDSYIILC